MSDETDYVLGTHDEEVERLGLQHRTWRPQVLAAWRRAGFNAGQTILDIGCGPGYAAFDLAEIVGPSGQVVAIDRSRRFLNVLEANRHQRAFQNITTHELDLDSATFPDLAADGAWCRWVFAFVQQPRELLVRVRNALRPGGVLVIQEYFDYATWRSAPPWAELEDFVSEVMANWRASGGEPDIGLWLPGWLDELDFEMTSLRPIVEIISREDPMWLWPKTFLESGRQRMADLGQISRQRADAIGEAFAAIEATPGALMVTPGVLQIVAVRR